MAQRATLHFGRTKANGKPYSPKHNDRNFNISKSPHIDPTRQHLNDFFHLVEEAPREATFEQAEQAFYESHFAEYLEAKNARNRPRHPDRIQSMEKYRKAPQSRPEEALMYLGGKDDHAPRETLQAVVADYVKWHRKKFPLVHILDIALHADEEGAPHVHLRQVWTHHDTKTGLLRVGQTKALEEMGVRPPREGDITAKNNPKITYTDICRERFQTLAREHGLDLVTEPRPRTESGRTLAAFRQDKAQEALAQTQEALAQMEATFEQKQAQIEAAFAQEQAQMEAQRTAERAAFEQEQAGRKEALAQMEAQHRAEQEALARTQAQRTAEQEAFAQEQADRRAQRRAEQEALAQTQAQQRAAEEALAQTEAQLGQKQEALAQTEARLAQTETRNRATKKTLAQTEAKQRAAEEALTQTEARHRAAQETLRRAVKADAEAYAGLVQESLDRLKTGINRHGRILSLPEVQTFIVDYERRTQKQTPIDLLEAKGETLLETLKDLGESIAETAPHTPRSPQREARGVGR